MDTAWCYVESDVDIRGMGVGLRGHGRGAPWTRAWGSVDTGVVSRCCGREGVKAGTTSDSSSLSQMKKGKTSDFGRF